MHSSLSRAFLGAAVMIALRWSSVDAQPTATAPAPNPASRRLEAASKLTEEAIATERAKDYLKAIDLYARAYQLEAHPTLQFNIGQAFMLAGDLDEAEKHFKHYLTLAPNGPGAPAARRFLESRPAPTASPRLATAPAPQPATPAQQPATTPASQPATPPALPPAIPPVPPALGSATVAKQAVGASGVARAPGPPSPAVGEARVTANQGESRPDQLTPASAAPALGDREDQAIGAQTLRASSSAPDEEAQRKRASRFQFAGYSLIGVGAVIGITAVGLGQEDHAVGLGIGAVAAGLAITGLVLHQYGDHQRRAAKSVAWSPAIGAGFAGVALSGTLP